LPLKRLSARSGAGRCTCSTSRRPVFIRPMSLG
jgi:hypothetical protein